MSNINYNYRIIFFVYIFLVVIIITNCNNVDKSFLSKRFNPIFSTSKIDSKIKQTILCNSNKTLNNYNNNYVNIIALTEDGTVIASKNFGFTWHNLLSNFYEVGKEKVDLSLDELSNIREMIQFPHQILNINNFQIHNNKNKKVNINYGIKHVNNNNFNYNDSTIFFLSEKNINWISFDCGQTITAFNNGRRLEDIKFHPLNNKWILTTAYTSLKDDDVNSIYKELFLSVDGGYTWEYLIDFVEKVEWGAYSISNILEQYMPKERIILTRHEDTNISENYDKSINTLNLIYSDDFFKHSDTIFTLVKDVKDFNINENSIYASNKNNNTLYYSKLNVFNFEFKTAVFNVDDNYFSNKNFKIIDVNNQDVLILVTSKVNNNNVGDIFMSNNKTVSGYFVMIGENIVFDVVNNNYIPHIVFLPHISDIIIANTKYNNKIISKISYNRGNSWSYIQAPLKDCEGNYIQHCIDFTTNSNNCFLYLHDINLNNIDTITNYNSIGPLISNGSIINITIKNQSEETNLYISNTNGMTWKEIRKSRHIFKIGNFGGIILSALLYNKTNNLIYSIDNGISFNSVELSTNLFYITNIEIVTNKKHDLNFIIYGYNKDNIKDKQIGITIGIDFKNVFNYNCKLYNEFELHESKIVNSNYSDYELNYIKGGYDRLSGEINECINGKKILYYKKKNTSLCYNTLPIINRIRVENCYCMYNDYQCDYGYKRENKKNNLSSCINISNNIKNYDKNILKVYNENNITNKNCLKIKTKGYIKNFNNNCISIRDFIEYDSNIYNICKNNHTKQNIKYIVIFMSISAFTAFLFVYIYTLLYNTKFSYYYHKNCNFISKYA